MQNQLYNPIAEPDRQFSNIHSPNRPGRVGNFPNYRANSGQKKYTQAIDSLRILFAERAERGDVTSKLPYSTYSDNITPHIDITLELIDNHIRFLEKNSLPRWRDISDEIFLTIGGKTLLDQNLYVPFSFNLSESLINRARQEKTKESANRSFKNYIVDSLRRNLKIEFNSNIPLVLVLEISRSNRIHAHGIIGIQNDESEHLKAARAFNRVNGENIPRAIVFSNPHSGVYWCSNYISKNLDKTRDFLNENPIFVDQETRNLAKLLWEGLRQPKQHQERPISRDELIKLQLKNLTRIRNLVSREETEIAKPTRIFEDKLSDDEMAEIDKLLNSIPDEIIDFHKPTNQRITPYVERMLSYFADSPKPKSKTNQSQLNNYLFSFDIPPSNKSQLNSQSTFLRKQPCKIFAQSRCNHWRIYSKTNSPKFRVTMWQTQTCTFATAHIKHLGP